MMTIRRSIGAGLAGALAAALLLTAAGPGRGQPAAEAPARGWEYVTLFANYGSNSEQLNEYGRKGWELAAVNNFPNNSVMYIMKRPRP